MVQRKVPTKLGIQDEHIKSENRLGNLKQTSCQNQDGKNRGPDMKKRMKRSKSIKLSDFESLNSSPLRKTLSQPGKPPPLSASTAAATPQKQQPIIRTGGSPNYMKATSSSEARKERSQVSSLNTPTASDCKHLRRRNSSSSKLSSASSNRATRTLTKSSSLKLVRTLTKSPSFKPVRNAARKRSKVALCADMDVRKATCSSTLKDLKFPAYLMLNPGGTEAEGTSVMKVCPYTYCSLNGHHRSPLPPLKCFLKARRRAMKVQKSAKLDVLSPCRAKVFGDGTEEIRNQLPIFSDDKAPHKEADSTNSAKIPMVKEVDMDFFVEIYAKNAAVGPEATEKHTGEDDVGTNSFTGEPNRCGGEEETAEHENMEQVDENLSNALPHLETDFKENYGSKSNSCMIGDFLAEQTADVNADYPAQGGRKTKKYDKENQTEGECHANMEEDDSITDMEWEEGRLPTSCFDIEAHYLDKSDKESCISDECLSDIKKFNLTEEPDITRSDDIISNCTEEILADEVLQELFEEETASSITHWSDSDSTSEGTLQTWEILETAQVAGDITYDNQLFSIEYAFEGPTTVEEKSEDMEKGSTVAVTASTSMESIVESTAVDENNQEDGPCETEHGIFENNPLLGDAEKDCNTNVTTEALKGHQEDKSLRAKDTTELLQGQNVSSQTLDEIGNAGTNEGQKSRETQTDQILVVTTSTIKEEEQVVNVKLSMGVQISDSSESFSEADQEDIEDNDTQNQITAEDSSSSEERLNQHIPAKDVQNENQSLLGEHEGGANKFKIGSSKDSEEQIDSSIHQISSERCHTGEVEKKEVELCNQSDTAETFFAATNGIGAGSKRKSLYKGSNSRQELASTFNNRKWMTKCKKPIMDLEEERKFNPREPNFLPVVPDPEAEKVDLRHQIMDDRKNAEEWMLDHALQQAVTKLAPARKRKVALLVEAFETVLPIPKYETHIRHASTAFSHTIRPIQACS
ncbi:calmodulin binding protein PICBP [Manihot esculenta]|uniref:Calmodulin-binding domain-containing protein n=1 Tax=Manihot esculenta TaxID=3983 RepID=A0A2C9W348_MANES|nr:calmodulin binding protein PICBP [Manihot esculenta]OAY53460.1 hypothetical protein MANES_04G164600v8 [Manihot esculenta]